MAAADKNQYVPAFREPHPISVQLYSEEKRMLSLGKDVTFTLTLILNLQKQRESLRSSTRSQTTQKVPTELFSLCLDIFQVTDFKNKLLTMQLHEYCVCLFSPQVTEKL